MPVVESSIESIIDKQGWSIESVNTLLIDYIKECGLQDAFLFWLQNKAAEECG